MKSEVKLREKMWTVVFYNYLEMCHKFYSELSRLENQD